MSLVFNNKRIGFNGKRLIASKAEDINVPPINDPDEPDNPDEPDDPGLPDPGDNPGGLEIG